VLMGLVIGALCLPGGMEARAKLWEERQNLPICLCGALDACREEQKAAFQAAKESCQESCLSQVPLESQALIQSLEECKKQQKEGGQAVKQCFKDAFGDKPKRCLENEGDTIEEVQFGSRRGRPEGRRGGEGKGKGQSEDGTENKEGHRGGKRGGKGGRMGKHHGGHGGKGKGHFFLMRAFDSQAMEPVKAFKSCIKTCVKQQLKPEEVPVEEEEDGEDEDEEEREGRKGRHGKGKGKGRRGHGQEGCAKKLACRLARVARPSKEEMSSKKEALEACRPSSEHLHQQLVASCQCIVDAGVPLKESSKTCEELVSQPPQFPKSGRRGGKQRN